MQSGTRHTSSRLAMVAILTLAGAATIAYQQVYATSQQQLLRAGRSYQEIAWVSSAAPEWREEYAQQIKSLGTSKFFVAAPALPDATSALQASLRQAIIARGAEIDALQLNTVERSDGQLPAVRANITLRAPAPAIIDILDAIETMAPRVAIESLDIAAQGVEALGTAQPLIRVTITTRSYAMVLSHATN